MIRLASAACLALILMTGCTPRDSSVDAASADESPFSFVQKDDRVGILHEGRPLTSFRFDSRWPKPFLYPIRTASGTVISRGYPVKPREGEEQDHPWHRGIWWGHGDINGEDFWREKSPESAGRLVLRGRPETEASAHSATLRATMDFSTPRGAVIGTLREQFTFQLDSERVIVDANIQIAADKGTALTFADSDDGGFAFRLADEFRQDRGAVLINSNGQQGTDNIWGKQAKWVDYSAEIEGKKTGVAIFDHPSNLRHPTGWHARGYSLNSANPFATRSFGGGAAPSGEYTLPEGDVLTLRYRVVIHEGQAGAKQIEEWYADFTR